MNWLRSDLSHGVPPGGYAAQLLFSTQGGTTSVDDFAPEFLLNTLTFDTGSVLQTLSGNKLVFGPNNGVGATLTVNATSAQSILNNFEGENDMLFNGTGTGVLTLSGQVEMLGGLHMVGSYDLAFNQTTSSNLFHQGIQVDSGRIDFMTTHSLNGADITLNGGTVKIVDPNSVVGNLNLGAGGSVATEDFYVGTIQDQHGSPYLGSFSLAGNMSFNGAVNATTGDWVTHAIDLHQAINLLAGNHVLDANGIGDVDYFYNAAFYGGLQGAGGLEVKNGSWFLATQDTFSGQLKLTGGYLVFNGENSLGTNGTIILNGGAIQPYGDATVSKLKTWNVTADSEISTFGYTFDLKGVIEGGGLITVTNTGTLNLDNPENVTKGGFKIIQSTLGVYLDGSLGTSNSSLTLIDSTLNFLNATRSVSGRTLTVQDYASIVDTGTNDAQLDWRITGNGMIVKKGQGALSLSGLSTNTAGYTAQEGLLDFADSRAFAKGATLVLAGGRIHSNAGLEIGDLVLGNDQTPVFVSLTGSHTISGNLIQGGLTDATATASLTANLQLLNGVHMFGKGAATLPTTITGVLSGPGSVDVTGGDWTFLNQVQYTGSTTISGGVLHLDSENALGSSALVMAGGTLDYTSTNPAFGNLALGDGTAVNFGSIVGTGLETIGGDVTFNNRANSVTTNRVVGTIGIATAFNGSDTIFSQQNAPHGAADVVAFTAPLQANTITLNGLGILLRSPLTANELDIQSGVADIGADNALPSSVTVVNNGKLNLIDPFLGRVHDLQIGSLSGTGIVDARQASFTLGTGDQDAIFNGAIYLSGNADAYGLQKVGAGRVQLNYVDNAGGAAANLEGGTLAVNTWSAAPDVVLNGGALECTPVDYQHYYYWINSVQLNGGGGIDSASSVPNIIQPITGSGNLSLYGSQAVVLPGNSTYKGSTSVSGIFANFVDDTSFGDPNNPLHLNSAYLEPRHDWTTSREIHLDSGISNIYLLNDKVQLNGAISGPGALTLNGQSSVEITHSNTYSGGTTVYYSNAILNAGDTTPLGTGPVLVTNVSSLAGVGTIGSLTNDGTVTAGLQGGTLHVAGDYIEHTYMNLVIEIGSATNYDHLVVDGTAYLGGSLTFMPLTGYVPKAGDTFTFLTAGSILNQFDWVGGLEVDPSCQVQVDFTSTSGTLRVVDSVPEPAPLVPVAIGALLVVRRRRLRRISQPA